MSLNVAISGMGIWSCIGTSIPEVLLSLREGRCGLSNNPILQEIAGYRSGNMGIPLLPADEQTEWLGKHKSTMSWVAIEAALAVKEALAQSGIKDLSRAALIVSNDSSAMEQQRVSDIMREKRETRYLGPYRVFKTLNSNISMNLAQVFGIGGLTLTVSAACAGGGHAIGLGYKMIKSGMADCVIVAGAQETGAYAFQAFDALGVLSTNDDPLQASLPFSTGRSGLVPSGGAACVILERYDLAKERDVLLHGFIKGYGYATSPNIVTPYREPFERSMTMALADFGIRHDMIDLVAAHATGTIAGDAAEAQAIWHLVGAHTPVTATKALTGHECWMAGVSQVIYTLLQMRYSFISPHPRYERDPELPCLDISTEYRVSPFMKYAICNAFGFGGTCSSLVISRVN